MGQKWGKPYAKQCHSMPFNAIHAATHVFQISGQSLQTRGVEAQRSKYSSTIGVCSANVVARLSASDYEKELAIDHY